MFPGFLLQILIVLIVVGLLLWVVEQIPMDATIKRIIRVVVIVFVCLWLIYILVGMFPASGGIYPYRRTP
jgi:hypothetical protein